MSKRYWLAFFAGLAVFPLLGYFFLWPSSEQDPSADQPSNISTTVNPNAQLSAEGQPLPAVNNESLLIEYVDDSQNAAITQARILYEADTGNYEVRASDRFGLIALIKHDQDHYYYDQESDGWYQISQSEALGYFDPSFLIFEKEEISNINKTIVYLGQDNCNTYRCAIWQAVYAKDQEDGGVVNLRVGLNDRKIYDVNVASSEINFTARYVYLSKLDVLPPENIILE